MPSRKAGLAMPNASIVLSCRVQPNDEELVCLLPVVMKTWCGQALSKNQSQ